MTTVISTKGQLVMPAAARKALGLKPGDRLRVTLEGRSVRLEPARVARAAMRIRTNRRTGLPYAEMGADAPVVTLAEVKRILADFP
ncbi:MAG: AbrB/MazE/SpoVT family DNA-binding domain-containing protein [Opitutaceae bacterium]